MQRSFILEVKVTGDTLFINVRNKPEQISKTWIYHDVIDEWLNDVINSGVRVISCLFHQLAPLLLYMPFTR